MTYREETSAGKFLRQARISAGLSQTEVARRALVAQSVISAYESGRREPSVSMLERLVRATGHHLVLDLERSGDYPPGLPDTLSVADCASADARYSLVQRSMARATSASLEALREAKTGLTATSIWWWTWIREQAYSP